MEEAHNSPGRRFSTGTNRSDHLVGCFGFVSHALLFFALGGLVMVGTVRSEPDTAEWLLVITSGLATTCLMVRALQVGATTTKESLKAIKDAWF